MVQSSNMEESVSHSYEELCADLNMDRDTANEALSSYDKIREHYSLEGNTLHWLACALYVACRKSMVPMVGRDDALVEGNCVSLTRLLRSSRLSLLEFFDKVKKWADMANLSGEFRERISKLERNFEVSSVIHQKFKPIFLGLFKDPECDPPRPPRSRKQRRPPCTPTEVFDFCWTLFIYVKGNFPAISDDLVNSYHLLLACCDFMFGNAVLGKRRDLLNPNFAGLPEGFNSENFTPPSEAPCVIETLCDQHDGLVIEARSIKEHWWIPYIKKLLDEAILRGNCEGVCGLLDQGNYEINQKIINKKYEEYVLSVGEFDERVFVSQAASSEIGTPVKLAGAASLQLREKMQVKKTLQQGSATTHLVPNTPLTGRNYLKSKEQSKDNTPVSTATQCVGKLHSLVSGRKAQPSEVLLDIFKSCSRNPSDLVAKIITEMGNTFCLEYSQPGTHHPGSNRDFAKNRLELAQTLFYKILENILVGEKKIKGDTVDLSGVLERDVLHQSLFACCIEIVIFSYNSQRTFPWILEIFELQPYYFYRVIEVLIRAEEQLTRDIVKHLNQVEEQILESLSWKSKSILWESLQESGENVPTCEDVSFPNMLSTNIEPTCNNPSPPPQLVTSPMNPIARKLTSLHGPDPLRSPMQSPISTGTGLERFQSPSGTAKRRLFNVAAPTGDSGRILTPVVVKSPAVSSSPMKSLLQPVNRPVKLNIQTIKGDNGIKYIPASPAVSGQNGVDTVIIKAEAGTPTPQLVRSLTATAMNTSSPCTLAKPLATTSQPASYSIAKPLTSTTQPVVSTGEIKDEKREKPKRGGSLGVFFRKFYYLASVRLTDLCSRLEIPNDLRQKVWTCFEYSVIQHTQLMKDRHLDQLLMCAVYVICKVTENDRTFQDIMKIYRLQPQSASHIYRSVLLASTSPCDAPVTQFHGRPLPEVTPRTCPPTPGGLAGTSTKFSDGERGDLIKFYNSVYIQKLQKFALKFSNKARQNCESVPLSPLPVVKSIQMSPRRKIPNYNSHVYVSPLQTSNIPSPGRQMKYSFNRSPAKDLQSINALVRIGSKKIGKRLLSDDDGQSGEEPKEKRQATEGMLRQLQGILEDRSTPVPNQISNG